MIGPLAYVGGKRRLAPSIVALLPPHTTYVEPFAGGAQVFFHKEPSRVEVLNDIDHEVVSFLLTLQHHHGELLRWMKWGAASRRLFEIFSRQDPQTLTDIQRAARFLYLQKNSFGGLRNKRSFAYAVTSKLRYSPARLPELLQAAAERLQRTQIECLPYQDLLARYDRPTTLFYCDPPYVGVRLYRHNFANDDFAELAIRLAALRGRFLLSLNDTPFTRATFGDFYSRSLTVSYSSSLAVPRVSELLFSNFPLPTA